jgi:hypothetical protein
VRCTLSSSVKGVAPLSADDNAATDTSDVIIPSPNRALAEQTDISSEKSLSVAKPHRDAHRHHHGVTGQEASRVINRMNDKTEEPSLESLAELEVDSIISHRKKGSQYQYLTKWVRNDIPDTWQERATFNQKEILEEYWNGFAKRLRPREFKKKVAREGPRKQPTRSTRAQKSDASEQRMSLKVRKAQA